MDLPVKSILQELIDRSPKIDLDEFLGSFKGMVFNGKKGFREARKYLTEKKGECVVIFHSWWVILKSGAAKKYFGEFAWLNFP